MRINRIIIFLVAMCSFTYMYAEEHFRKGEICIESDTCYYVLFTRNLPKDIRKYSDSYISQDASKIMTRDIEGRILKQSYPVFSWVTNGTCSSSGELNCQIIGKDEKIILYHMIYIRLDNELRLKYVNSPNVIPHGTLGKDQVEFVSKGICRGLVDSCGRYIYAPVYDDVFCANDETLEMDAISVLKYGCADMKKNI